MATLESFARVIPGLDKASKWKNMIFHFSQYRILVVFDFGDTSLCREILHLLQNSQLVLKNEGVQ